MWCNLLSCPYCPSFLKIKEKLLQLTEKRKEMIDKWEDRWEWLRLSKDVLNFSILFGCPLKACKFSFLL